MKHEELDLVEVPAHDPDDSKMGLDLGDAHYLRPIGRYGEGSDLVFGFIESHARPDNGERCEGYVSVDPASPKHWTVESVRPLTLSPSLLCTICGNHGFVRGGKWVPA